MKIKLLIKITTITLFVFFSMFTVLPAYAAPEIEKNVIQNDRQTEKNVQSKQNSTTLTLGTKYLYGQSGLLDYIHLPTGNFMKHIYDNNGNLLKKNLVSLVPEHSLPFTGDNVIELSNLAINTQIGNANTVEFWMYWDGTEGVMPFSWKSGYDLFFQYGYFGFNTFNGEVLGVPSSSFVNKWVHVATVFYNGLADAQSCELYIDGIKQRLAIIGTSPTVSSTADTNAFIGGFKSGGSNYYSYKGKISNLRIWNKKQEVSIIQKNMYRNVNKSDPTLVGEWLLTDPPVQSKKIEGNKVTNLSDLNITTSIGGKNTVEFWMYWDGRETAMPFAWSSQYDLYFSGGYFGFNIFNGDVLGIPSASLKNKWVHVAAIFYNGIPDVNNTELYINGKKQTLRAFTTGQSWSVQASSNAHIGGFSYNMESSYMFNGYLADLRIWNRALSSSEISSSMYSILKGNENGLVGEWKLADKPIGSTKFSGEKINELEVLGVNTTIGGKNTVEFWMYWDGTEVVMPFAWSSEHYDLYLVWGHIGFNIFNGDILGASSAQLKNKWVHIAAVFYNGVPDENNVELYINGERQTLKSLQGAAKMEVRTSKKINLGGYKEGNVNLYVFKGSLAQLKIWNRALTSNEIKSRMYQTLPDQTPNLVGQWELRESDYLLVER
ncbi:LamG domain-containing protein [Paenibacillus radicis (ex Gao et al. 2016)]|uniref:LamG domain-containing protein n=1 Tax=Paenibacillus radicis (ex Gao et al. 2016) TaxID=1737354 RepID=A0A917HQZ7_9BACL|nr:LamG domain-containing protein [Paenibacillus radicis (ex Gao et al. 2016)]GGG86306.1 hypothetical protein GCM10010918_50610 [Paenibacillus radicis (ex Gao et al. 2016)]